jgi:hypothetical protein
VGEHAAMVCGCEGEVELLEDAAQVLSDRVLGHRELLGDALA